MNIRPGIFPLVAWPRLAAPPAAVLALALALALPSLLLGSAPAQAQAPAPAVAAPPLAPVRDVTETFFGTAVPDPYRYLEDKTAPEVQSWMKAQGDYTTAILERIPGRDAMLERLLKYDSAVAGRVAQVARTARGLWFYEWRGADDNQFKLYMRAGLSAPPHLLVDPEALEKATGKPHAMNYYSASPDGRRVAYGLSQQGSEAAVLHMVDTTSGKPVGQPIDRADFGGVSWTPDASRYVFTRLQKLDPGMAATEKYQRAQVLLMKPGQDVSRARSIFGHGVKGVDIGPAELPFVSFTHDGRWALGYAINGTQREIGLFLAPAPGVLAGQPQWTRVLDASAEVTTVTYMNNRLHLLSNKGAPRGQLLSLDLGPARPDIRQARPLVAQSQRVLTGVAAAADALYIEARDGNIKRLYRQAYAKGAAAAPAPVELALPVSGSFQLADDEGGNGAADPRLPGLVLDLQGWTRARQIYQVNADGQVVNTKLQPAGPHDAPDDITATEVVVPSHDGAPVPLSILHKKSVKLDGSNPTVLYGYASYGITEEPFFSLSRLAWLDAGGVFAIANPRGSSVYGVDWYKAGFQQTKPNTWKDTIACAEWLIAQRYTRADKLGVWGGSAGGILVGRAITTRPDLFAAAVPAVGALDGVRFETTANGVPNIPEFGTRTTEAGFRALLEMSTYANVKPGVAYPAVMLTHGVNDPRVEVWQSTKTAARLQAATTSGKPVLLRLEWNAGHGIGNTKRQQWAERADVFSFFLWQMGIPGYQPAP